MIPFLLFENQMVKSIKVCFYLIAKFLNSTMSLEELIFPEHNTIVITHFLKDYREFAVQNG